MKTTICKCDLCGSVIDTQKQLDPKIKIKKKPSGGWAFETVANALDLSPKCEKTIFEKMSELIPTKTTNLRR